MQQARKIILASTSPRRKELFSITGLDFEVVASDYEEDMTLDMPPHELAKTLSRGKAEAVVKDCPNHIIIGADTFIALEDQVLGKPHTAEKAKEMLEMISGKKLSLFTGYTVIDSKSGEAISEAIETMTQIKKLTESEIDNYIATGEPLDRAGAFAIQELGALIVERVEGDYLAAVGLPLYPLMQTLKKFGISVL